MLKIVKNIYIYSTNFLIVMVDLQSNYSNVIIQNIQTNNDNIYGMHKNIKENTNKYTNNVSVFCEKYSIIQNPMSLNKSKI